MSDTEDLTTLTAEQRLQLKRLLEELARRKDGDVAAAVRELGDVITERDSARKRWGGLFDRVLTTGVTGALVAAFTLLLLGVGTWAKQWLETHGIKIGQ